MAAGYRGQAAARNATCGALLEPISIATLHHRSRAGVAWRLGLLRVAVRDSDWKPKSVLRNPASELRNHRAASTGRGLSSLPCSPLKLNQHVLYTYADSAPAAPGYSNSRKNRQLGQGHDPLSKGSTRPGVNLHLAWAGQPGRLSCRPEHPRRRTVTSRLHVLTIALECYIQVTPPNRMIHPGRWFPPRMRLRTTTRNTLDQAEGCGVRATLSVLVWAANAAPERVRKVAPLRRETARRACVKCRSAARAWEEVA